MTRIRARGALPALVTSPVRRLFSGTTLTPTALHINSIGVDPPTKTWAVSTATGVPLLDLTAGSKALVESLGIGASARLYLTTRTDGVTDTTHFSQYGATRMAELVVQGIRERNLPLVAYMRT